MYLAALRSRGCTQKEIASALRVNQSVISREIARNSRKTDGIYDPHYAHHEARLRKRESYFQWKNIRRISDLERYIIRHLQRGWPPEMISLRMKRLKKNWYASKNTIYRWLYSPFGREYCRYLLSGHKRKKNRGEKKTRKALIPNRVSIHERPELTGYGHYEADTIVSGKHTKSTWALVTITNIKLGYIDARRVRNLKPETVLLAFKSMFGRLQSTETITFDNGQENRNHEELEALHFFCDPYSSWQKPQIENANKLLRRDILKGSDIGKYSDLFIANLIKRRNSAPRKRLHGMTPNECMRKHKLFKKRQKPH